MRTNKFRTKQMSDKKIYKEMMKVKGIIDTIAEEKGLDDSHDLCLASNHLNNFLDAIEAQTKR